MANWEWTLRRGSPTRNEGKEVVLLDAEQYDGGFPEDKNAHGFIKWLEALIEQAPPEYQAGVYIELDSTSGYEGSHYAHVKVAYRRPETDAELAARVAEYEEALAQKEAHDRAEFERLKSKFDQPLSAGQRQER